jgi:hypothetical protein
MISRFISAFRWRYSEILDSSAREFHPCTHLYRKVGRSLQTKIAQNRLPTQWSTQRRKRRRRKGRNTWINSKVSHRKNEVSNERDRYGVCTSVFNFKWQNKTKLIRMKTNSPEKVMKSQTRHFPSRNIVRGKGSLSSSTRLLSISVWRKKKKGEMQRLRCEKRK